MFSDYDPREGKFFKLLSEDGTLSQEASKYPKLSNEQVLTAYKTMVLARAADDWAVSLNRQGRLPTYPPNKGQEANSVGSLMALNKDDWFVQAFREIGGMLVRGIPLRQQYLYWLGNEMGSKFNKEKYFTTPISVPIGSQSLHAVGLAYGERYLGRNRAAIAFVGDGGTSEGEFYEALNFAGVWKVPVIFYVQNNHWAISTPRHEQTAAKTLAQKSFACGFSGIQIDGNDIFAVYAATKFAADKGRNGEGPALIEGVTYRLGAHTTADDPTKYRSNEEVKKWEEKDPILRLERYILKQKLLSEQDIKKIKETSEKLAKDEFEEADKTPLPTLEDTFYYQYKDLPPIMAKQLESKKILQKKESL